MRRIVIVLILSGLALNMLGQKTFVPFLETYKWLTVSGGIPPAVTKISTFNGVTYFGGWIDSCAPWVRSGNNYVLGPMIRGAENMVQYENGVWSDGPDFVMSSPGTYLTGHDTVYGKQYASVEGTSFPNNRVLNPTTNQFDSIDGVHFDYGWSTQMIGLGNDEILFYSKNGSGGSVNGVQYNSTVVWNQRTHAVRHLYDIYQGETYDGLPGWGIGAYRIGDTIFSFQRFEPLKVVGLGPNSSVWSRNTRFGVVPGFDMECARVFDGIPYIVVKYVTDRQTGDYIYRLYRFVNNHWEKLLDMDPVDNQRTYFGIVLGMEKYDNKIAILAYVKNANGKAVNGLFFYDPVTGVVSDMAPFPSNLTRGPFDCVGMFAPGDGNLYLSAWKGRAGVTGMESQTVYVLRSAPPAAPVITAPTGTIGTTSVTVPGTCEADTSIQVSVYEGQTVIGTAKADNTGKWSFTYTATEGSHTIYAFATRPQAERSTQSANVSFTVHINRAPTVTIGDTLVISHASNATIAGTANDPDGDILTYRWTQISGPTTATIANDGLLSTTASNLSEGSYRFKLTATDPGGLTASQTMTVQVSFITSVPPVIQNGTVILYPNPTASSLHMKGVTKVLTVHNMAGQQLGVLQEKVGNETVLQVYHYPTGTYFVTFEYTGRKTATAAFRVVR